MHEVIAYQTKLDSTAIEEAYMLGLRNDKVTAEFVAPYLKQVTEDNMPAPERYFPSLFERFFLLALSSSMARASTSLSGLPTPPAWLRTKFVCNCARFSFEIRTSANLPNPVFTPYTGCPSSSW